MWAASAASTAGIAEAATTMPAAVGPIAGLYTQNFNTSTVSLSDDSDSGISGSRLRTLIALPGLVLSLQPQIETEERVLTTLFGDEYEAYRAAVPRWI